MSKPAAHALKRGFRVVRMIVRKRHRAPVIEKHRFALLDKNETNPARIVICLGMHMRLGHLVVLAVPASLA